MTLDGDPIEVTVGLDARRIHLTSNGLEIGSWGPEECRIVANAGGGYLIIAENEELAFSPSSDERFASALAAEENPQRKSTPGHARSAAPKHIEEGAPRPLTMVGFFLLAALTSLLGIWALWSLVV